jgi:hypothetical protein
MLDRSSGESCMGMTPMAWPAPGAERSCAWVWLPRIWVLSAHGMANAWARKSCAWVCLPRTWPVSDQSMGTACTFEELQVNRNKQTKLSIDKLPIQPIPKLLQLTTSKHNQNKTHRLLSNSGELYSPGTHACLCYSVHTAI